MAEHSQTDSRPQAEPASDYISKYPEKYHDLLTRLGEDDRGIPALIGYNHDLIQLAEDCQGKDHRVFEVGWGRLLKDWARVRMRHETRSLGIPEFAEHRPSGERPVDPHGHDLDDDAQEEREWRRRTGIAFTQSMFRRMEKQQRGPWALGDFASWLTGVFELKENGLELPDLGGAPPADTSASGRPVWLLAGEGEDADTRELLDHLTAWGADVIFTTTALEAAQIASDNDIAGAVVCLRNNVEAEFVIADLLMRRQLPFLVIATRGKRPDTLGLGGVVVHEPTSIGEIRAALEALPERKLKGMDFSAQVDRNDC